MTATDIAFRLRSLLPARWFADATPVLDGLTTGICAGWAHVHDMVAYTARQTRIATATDGWLDRIAADYFPPRARRRAREDDAAFSARIRRELLRERGTRAAVSAVLTDLTGRAPVIFEPARAADTGAWNGPGGYGAAGAWGSFALPFQCFVTAFRPQGTGIADVSGWNAPAGGWGGGRIEYASLAMIAGQVTDADIHAAIADVLPAATIAWTRISN